MIKYNMLDYKEIHPNDKLVKVNKNGKTIYENIFRSIDEYYQENKPISIINKINSNDKWIDDYLKQQDENKVTPTNEELTNMFFNELKETGKIDDDIFDEMVNRFIKTLKK